MGGFTHSNPYHTGITLENVGSIDLTSSYPSVMCAELYPMSRPKELHPNSYDELKQLAKTYCIVLDVKFIGLKNILGYESYISEAAGKKQVIFFADRFDHFLNEEGDGYAAHIGGITSICTDAQAAWWKGKVAGTIPHALIAVNTGDTIEATRQFSKPYRDW